MITIDLETRQRARIVEKLCYQIEFEKWARTPAVQQQYGQFIKIDDTTMTIDNEADGSAFAGRSEKWIKDWIASHIKSVVQEEVGNNKEGWQRSNKEYSDLMSADVCDCYECYDFLKGRSVKRDYGQPWCR